MQCSGIFTDWMRKLSSRQGAKPEKNGLPFGAGCIFGGVAAKSAFALLLTKVTKHDRHIWRFKMKERRFIEEDDLFYDRERLPEP